VVKLFFFHYIQKYEKKHKLTKKFSLVDEDLFVKNTALQDAVEAYST